MEAKLQKLKVTELKDLLAKNHLVQSGKKDDLIKRLMDNNVGVDDGAENPEDELIDPDVAVPEVSTIGTAEPAAPSDTTAPAPATETAAPALTEEQQALKARAERFGIPFNPNPSSTPKSTKSISDSKESKEDPVKPTPAQKPSAIDSNPLGLSAELLAKRAAKFGLPEKKEEKTMPAVPQVAVVSTAKKTEEITPEMAEKIAIEEEKKRKRLEKFGPVKPVTTTTTDGASTNEPDAKKVKV